MEEQIREKKYRAFCFPADWPAILHKFRFVRTNLTNATPDQACKLYANTGPDSGSVSDLTFAFTNQFVICASTMLEGNVIRTAINHLNGKPTSDGS